jgi:hypothetical protein
VPHFVHFKVRADIVPGPWRQVVQSQAGLVAAAVLVALRLRWPEAVDDDGPEAVRLGARRRTAAPIFKKSLQVFGARAWRIKALDIPLGNLRQS